MPKLMVGLLTGVVARRRARMVTGSPNAVTVAGEIDQLNPRHAKYYHGQEVERLLADAGFTEIRRYHRHGYSWTAIGTKPLAT